MFWATWQRLHPDWRCRTWTEDDLPRLDNQDLYDAAEKLTVGNVWQLRSDLVRYELLWRYGGVYVDADMEPRRALDRLLEGVAAFAAWERQDVWVNNAILGCEEQHPFLRRLIDGAHGSVMAHRKRRPNHATGPRYITAMHRSHPLDLQVFEERLFYPYSWSELDRAGETFPDAYTVHHWANARRMRAAKAR